ncbi:hypothetical protein GCM10027286_04460 [Virgibacillus ainsalahensis]
MAEIRWSKLAVSDFEDIISYISNNIMTIDYGYDVILLYM